MSIGEASLTKSLNQVESNSTDASQNSIDTSQNSIEVDDLIIPREVLVGKYQTSKPILPFSKSKLSTFDFCPFQFRKRYIEEIRSESNYSMSVGTRFHFFAQQYFTYRNQVGDPYNLIHPDYSPEEVEWLKWFINQEEARRKITTKYQPILLEEDIHNHSLDIHGIVDRVDELDSGLLPYLELNRTSKRLAKNIKEGRKSLCIVEYKTGKSFYEKGLKKEISFYKLCLQGDSRFKDYEILCGCVVNPRLGIIKYIDFEREATTFARIRALKAAMASDTFERTCTFAKHQMCNLCTLEEAGLYHSDEWWEDNPAESVPYSYF